MKKTYIFCAVVFFTLTVWAQSPKKMSYQAVIRNTSNTLVSNTNICMKISILTGASSGPVIYVETQTPSTNSNGLVNIEIGGGTVVSGNFSSINWANGTFFLKTEIDPDGLLGGISYTIISTSQLLSVPYALYADNAGTVTSGNDFTHYIGEEFGGGVIFHLWKDIFGVEHGLILALNDQSSAQVWSNITSTEIGPSAQSLWDGLNNSNSIVAQVGHTNSAAKLCLELVSGGQSDWYLPSIEELNILKCNLLPVLRAMSQISGANLISNNAYWSSSEESEFGAFGLMLDWCQIFPGNKIFEASVRAIRAF